jgi:NAD(P)-dependent dehydrogenase (short-subunit alcohol dehydrogenase family)
LCGKNARVSFPERPRAAITGAGGGFGRAIALRLAKNRRARLVVSDIDEAAAEETASIAKREGATDARAMRCDVREAAQVEAFADLADEAFGGTDILVNNAGVAVAGSVGDVPLEDWRWQIDINLWGVIHGCHFFVPRMKKHGSGFVLNVASMAGLVQAPQLGPYNVTKAGVVALSETMYAELAGSGVHVTALCPTFFRTNIHKAARTSDEALGSRVEKLVERSKWSAEAIADIALDGLERGELYVIPQTDGKIFWRAKRALGKHFFGVMGRVLRTAAAAGK